MTDYIENETSEDILARLDNSLVNLRALAKIVLYVSESCNGNDFKMLKGEMNTMFYMMIDNVDDCSDASESLALAAREAEEQRLNG
ncbi:hypothetical protein [Martelella mangrovi]|uniref:Uncharacterized protein n=1 Tax=Martelella mangrovi TaxID=1397477 RepID=A0ABV2IFR5_9HYPH